jgi:hypothetical protein
MARKNLILLPKVERVLVEIGRKHQAGKEPGEKLKMTKA